MWRPVDWLAGWLCRHMNAGNQLRLGIVCVAVSLPLWVYGPFSGEPLLIYLMSAAALTLTGVGLVIGAQVMHLQEEES